jgi:hypothetical protein
LQSFRRDRDDDAQWLQAGFGVLLRLDQRPVLAAAAVAVKAVRKKILPWVISFYGHKKSTPGNPGVLGEAVTARPSGR